MAEQGTAATDSGTAPQQGQGNGLHEQFISSAPEHLRDAARELVPTWDQYVQKQFTDHAGYRSQWEPYEQLGVNEIEPNELQELLEFREILQDEDSFRQWYESIGQLLGGEDGEGQDPEDGEQPQIPRELQQFMQDFYATQQQQQEQQMFQQTAMQVRSELDDLKKNNPDLSEEDEDYICTLALKYDGNDAIQRGFQDFQKLLGRAESGVFNNKTSPDLRVAPVSGGNQDTSVEPVTTFEQAARAARERMRQSH